jgi:dTDP-4-dehydrorhamnose 3,5-epimerase
MRFIKTSLQGVLVIEPDVYRDERGFFFESYHLKKYQAGGILPPFVQDNHSRSSRGVLRGLHAQLSHPQGKLVRVLLGEIFDVVVDIQRGSPTYKKWFALNLSAENCKQCYVPPGYAHGFYTLSEVAEMEYKCTDFYDPADELHLLWNDPDLAIEWPVKNPILSAKDRAALRLSQIEAQLPVFQPLK